MSSVLQLNPLGMPSNQDGYVSSITICVNGSPVVFTPDGNGQIGATGNVLSDTAAGRLAKGQNTEIVLVTGA